MATSRIVRFRLTPKREMNIKNLSMLLNESNFSKLMDTIFELALERLSQKDEIRREMAKQAKLFGLKPEDVFK